MSKIGKLPVTIPDGVVVETSPDGLKVSGPKGTLTSKVPKGITFTQSKNEIVFEQARQFKQMNSLYGTTRALFSNTVKGVSDGWKKELELVGTGYRAEVVGKDLVLTVGFSHPVKIEAPGGISFKVEKTMISVEGIDRELVGQVAANIRKVRPPEPYKGKGIKYKDEVVRRKAGKAAKASTGGAG